MSAQVKLILWLLSLAIVLGALFGAYRYGRHVEGFARDSQQLDAVTKAVDRANELARADKEAALKSAQKDAARHIAESGRDGRVERSIAAHTEYVACALDAADLEELIAAVEGK